jgi:hypothetical protein
MPNFYTISSEQMMTGGFPRFILLAHLFCGEGSFNDGFNINHGFVRARDGTLATLDAPGAGTGNFQGTAPWASPRAA